MKSDVENAIRDMKCIEFFYEGFPRIVEPHCCGISFRGNYIVRAFQFGGSSSSGKLGWRLFDIDKIQNLIILDGYFNHTRSDYTRGDKNMQRIIVEL